MRILLDTNIIIHREASKISHPDIGVLFQWLDKLRHDKCIHQLTVAEIKRHGDLAVVKSMQLKLHSYHELKTEAPIHETVKAISERHDRTDNDLEDTRLLNEVFCDRVDILVSEDKKIHVKAAELNLSDRVFRIDKLLEKFISENPDLVDYRVLAVKQSYFGNVALDDEFFESFREDYKGFDTWFKGRSDKVAYVCYHEERLSAFLYVKVEEENENYGDITPPFSRKKRLKIGTFKVTSNGFKLGERFLKIVFDNARQYKVDEIYVTIFDKRDEQLRLIELLETWGFTFHGTKETATGQEKVFVRDFKREADIQHPKHTYPRLSKTSDVFIVPIYPEYHTELFPDSILRTESPMDFVENQPHRNALSKVYISHSHGRNLKRGDIIVFYRTGGYYKSVVTTIGIVEDVIHNIASAEELLQICRKRTVISDSGLKEFWNRYKTSKPFVVNFLYAYSFKNRPNMKALIELGVIADSESAPRGFEKISRESFLKILNYAGLQ